MESVKSIVASRRAAPRPNDPVSIELAEIRRGSRNPAVLDSAGALASYCRSLEHLLALAESRARP
jgi:hypothetical protein